MADLKINGVSPVSIKIGATDIASVYAGTVKIWPIEVVPTFTLTNQECCKNIVPLFDLTNAPCCANPFDGPIITLTNDSCCSEGDIVPPSDVTGLVTTNIGGYGPVGVSWNAAIDNVGVDHYEVWRNNEGGIYSLLTTTVTTSISDDTVLGLVTHCYKVKAVDALGNKSVNYSNVDCESIEED